MICIALTTIATLSILPLVFAAPFMRLATLFVLGGAIMSFYSLGLTMLGQKIQRQFIGICQRQFYLLFVFGGNHWPTGNWHSYGYFWDVCFRLVNGAYFFNLLGDFHLRWEQNRDAVSLSNRILKRFIFNYRFSRLSKFFNCLSVGEVMSDSQAFAALGFGINVSWSVYCSLYCR